MTDRETDAAISLQSAMNKVLPQWQKDLLPRARTPRKKPNRFPLQTSEKRGDLRRRKTTLKLGPSKQIKKNLTPKTTPITPKNETTTPSTPLVKTQGEDCFAPPKDEDPMEQIHSALPTVNDFPLLLGKDPLESIPPATTNSNALPPENLDLNVQGERIDSSLRVSTLEPSFYAQKNQANQVGLVANGPLQQQEHYDASKQYDLVSLAASKVLSAIQVISLETQITQRFQGAGLEQQANFMRCLALHFIPSWNSNKNKLYQWYFQLYVAKGTECSTCHRWFGNAAYYHEHVSFCKFRQMKHFRLQPPSYYHDGQPKVFCLLCPPGPENRFPRTHKNEAILFIHMRFAHPALMSAQAGFPRDLLETAIQYSQARSNGKKGIQTFNPVQFQDYDFMLKGLLYTDAHPLLSDAVLRNIMQNDVAFLTKGHTNLAPRIKLLPMPRPEVFPTNHPGFKFNKFMQNLEDLDFEEENLNIVELHLYRLRIPFVMRRNTPVYVTMRWFDRTEPQNSARLLHFYESAYAKLENLQGLLIPQRWEKCGDWAVAFHQPVGRSLKDIVVDAGIETLHGDPMQKLMMLKHIVMADLVEGVKKMRELACYSCQIVPEKIFVSVKSNNVFIGEFLSLRETEEFEPFDSDFPYYAKPTKPDQKRVVSLQAEVRAATMVGIQMTLATRNIMLDAYQDEPNQDFVLMKVLPLLQHLISDAEQQAIRRIFFNDAIGIVWQAFVQLGYISCQYCVKDMATFRQLKGLNGFRVAGGEDHFNPAVTYDIGQERQTEIQEMNFQDFLLQDRFYIPQAVENAMENPMDILPRNIAHYTQY